MISHKRHTKAKSLANPSTARKDDNPSLASKAVASKSAAGKDGKRRTASKASASKAGASKSAAGKDGERRTASKAGASKAGASKSAVVKLSVAGLVSDRACAEASAVGAGGEDRIYGFAAFVPERATVLILGSMPSVKSLEQGFYYAHPQNRMFKLIARYLSLKQTGSFDNAKPLTTVEERKAALSELGIAMWDTVDSCVRSGSLDSSIKAASYADIASLLRKYPSITCVITAGGFSAKAFKKSTLSLPEVVSGELSFEYHALPSTSPANTVSFEKICEAYDGAILPHLNINAPD